LGVIKILPSPGKKGVSLEENMGVKEDVADPSTKADAEQPSEQKETLKTKEDSNWKEARDVMRNQQERIQELEDKLNSSNVDSLESDDIATVAQVRELAEKQAKEFHEKSQADIKRIEAYSQYPDFQKVVSQENIKKLETQYPSLAEGISKSSNPFVGAYEAIKTIFGESERTVSEAAKKAEENLNKPQSVYSQPYQGALSDVKNFENRMLSQEKKQEIWNLSKRYAASR